MGWRKSIGKRDVIDALEIDELENDGWRKPRPGFVYFVQAELLRHVKIGFAANVEKRLSQLQSGSPDKLELLGVILTDDMESLERYLHNRFRRDRLHCEWFAASDAVREFVAGNASSLARAQATRIARGLVAAGTWTAEAGQQFIDTADDPSDREPLFQPPALASPVPLRPKRNGMDVVNELRAKRLAKRRTPARAAAA
jgi:hypothetical protein